MNLLNHVAVFQNSVPPHTPVAHWPWWLRLLAVLGVVVFIRVAVGLARGSGRQG